MLRKPLSEYGKQLEQVFVHTFYTHGKLVGTYPGYFLIGSLIFTVICSTGLARFQVNLDLYELFIPVNVPSRAENDKSTLFRDMPWGDLSNQHSSKTKVKRETVENRSDTAVVYAVRKNQTNLFESKTLAKLYGYSQEVLQVTAEHEGKVYHFESFCKKSNYQSKCDNQANRWMIQLHNLLGTGRSENNPNMQLSYPIMVLFNRPIDVGSAIYGVTVSGEKREITAARVLTLHWPIEFVKTPELSAAYVAYQKAVSEFWRIKSDQSEFDFSEINANAMDDEMLSIIGTTLPFIPIIAAQLMLFVVLSNVSHDRTKSKPLEAFLAVVSVVLSLLCTLGILFHLGFRFSPVCCTMPFLILAIGVDDAFLMLGAWRWSDTKLSVEERLAVTMSDAGASITATSFTNFGCFALGYFLCSTPAVSDFCLLMASGVMLDYFFQITFFASIMVYGGRREATGGLLSSCYQRNRAIVVTDVVRKADEMRREEQPFMHRLFGTKYAPFILRKDVMVVSWLLFFAYATLAIYGCSSIAVDISPKKYVRDNSPIQRFVHLADKYIWADNVMPIFYVMKPPDLRNARARARLNELVYRLEHTKYSIGRVSTSFWLWEYQRFLNDFPDIDYETEFYDQKHLSDFFAQFDYKQYREFVKIKENSVNGEPCIAAFSFQTSFYGLDSWNKREVELFHWRRILSDYTEFDVVLAGILSPFLIDQRHNIAPSSMQAIGSAIAIMGFISVFFLPDKQSVFFMTWSLLSISMGVCGGLSMWGSDLDSVSMGCIVMAIGLAVDFSVHICYRYHRSEQPTAHEKVYDTLSVVGWPILQAGGSTLFAMIPLPLVPAYIVRVFFQTVILVNVIGLTHALLWLPQLISALDPCERIPLRNRH